MRIAGSSELLLKEVRGNGDHARWALDRLRRSFPAIWADHLIGGFRDGNLEERRNLFQTLAAANPRTAKDLIALMSPPEIGDLLIEVASFQNEQDPPRRRTGCRRCSRRCASGRRTTSVAGRRCTCWGG